MIGVSFQTVNALLYKPQNVISSSTSVRLNRLKVNKTRRTKYDLMVLEEI